MYAPVGAPIGRPRGKTFFCHHFQANSHQSPPFYHSSCCGNPGTLRAPDERPYGCGAIFNILPHFAAFGCIRRDFASRVGPGGLEFKLYTCYQQEFHRLLHRRGLPGSCPCIQKIFGFHQISQAFQAFFFRIHIRFFLLWGSGSIRVKRLFFRCACFYPIFIYIKFIFFNLILN